jgi:hypothetical protein
LKYTHSEVVVPIFSFSNSISENLFFWLLKYTHPGVVLVAPIFSVYNSIFQNFFFWLLKYTHPGGSFSCSHFLSLSQSCEILN